MLVLVVLVATHNRMALVLRLMAAMAAMAETVPPSRALRVREATGVLQLQLVQEEWGPTVMLVPMAPLEPALLLRLRRGSVPRERHPAQPPPLMVQLVAMVEMVAVVAMQVTQAQVA